MNENDKVEQYTKSIGTTSKINTQILFKHRNGHTAHGLFDKSPLSMYSKKTITLLPTMTSATKQTSSGHPGEKQFALILH